MQVIELHGAEIIGTGLAVQQPRINKEDREAIMELYFKDFEGEGDLAEMSMDQGHDFVETVDASDEEAAFAELAERVSAARLVF